MLPRERRSPGRNGAGAAQGSVDAHLRLLDEAVLIQGGGHLHRAYVEHGLAGSLRRPTPDHFLEPVWRRGMEELEAQLLGLPR